MTKKYDLVIVGGGAGGLFLAYELCKGNTAMNVAIIEKWKELSKRHCPIVEKETEKCAGCEECSITCGLGGSGAFSDGKFNITNDFGGDFAKYVGEEDALRYMNYVDEINMSFGGEGTKRYDAADCELKRKALEYDLHFLDAEVRHLGTDKNYVILSNIVEYIKDKVDIYTDTEVKDIKKDHDFWYVSASNKSSGKIEFLTQYVVVAVGRSGSEWVADLCSGLKIKVENNRVDIGVRFECPSVIWKPITDKVYESKIMYRSPVTGCTCRTFCMNPNGSVVAENTNGIMTVNGHSYEDSRMHTDRTNFALLVSHNFTEPFKDSNAYGKSIAKLANMLSGGVMVQRFGDLVDNKRSNRKRMEESFVKPTLKAEPGNIGLVIPKLTLDTIIEMIYALDKFVPGTANHDNLLYATEVKFYNSKVDVDSNFETMHKGLYIIGDASGTTHSLSQASGEGVYVARVIDCAFKNDILS